MGRRAAEGAVIELAAGLLEGDEVGTRFLSDGWEGRAELVRAVRPQVPRPRSGGSPGNRR